MIEVVLIVAVAAIYLSVGVVLGLLWSGGWRLNRRQSELASRYPPEPRRPARGKH